MTRILSLALAAALSLVTLTASAGPRGHVVGRPGVGRGYPVRVEPRVVVPAPYYRGPVVGVGGVGIVGPRVYASYGGEVVVRGPVVIHEHLRPVVRRGRWR